MKQEMNNDDRFVDGVSQILEGQQQAQKANNLSNDTQTKRFRVGIKRLTAIVIGTAIISIICTGAIHWNVGYPISERMGWIPADTLSGAASDVALMALREEVSIVREERRAVKQKNINLVEVVRAKNEELKEVDDLKMVNGLQEKEIEKLKNQVAELNRQLAKEETEFVRQVKIKYERLESLQIMTALLHDDANLLKKSETSNQFRRDDTYGKPHKFTFNKWNYAWQEKLISRAVAIGSYNCLEYIMSQKGWDDYISKELASKTMLAVKKNSLRK